VTLNIPWTEAPDLSRLPSTDRRSFARLAVLGAREQLNHIERLLRANEALSAEEFIELQWRTRSFFWELIGAWDLYLYWCKDHCALIDIKPQLVNTKNVLGANSNHVDWAAILAVLKPAAESAWHFELSRYRNYAHRSFFEITALRTLRDGKEQLFLPMARVGQDSHFKGVVGVMELYLQNIESVGEQLSQI
jgi:hypothetical protein